MNQTIIEQPKGNYCIYARKSSESEERQILSISSQVDELRDLSLEHGARLERLTRTEAMSAKAPGRPVFGTLMQDIQEGKIHGIVCWKLDRLARNPVDGGALIWALDQGKLRAIVTPGRSFSNTAEDKFWMQLEFGMAKKYVDDLAINVKRGLRKKLQMGWAPGPAPLGYLNDRIKKTIIKDPERFRLVQQMWELLVKGDRSVAEIYDIATNQWGLTTPRRGKIGGGALHFTRIYDLFLNPFYCGMIRYGGGLYPGRHTSMITAATFQQAQKVLGRDQVRKRVKHVFPFTGLMQCGECGSAITAETHTKPSGRVYVYYRCTKKKKRCSQPFLRVETLEEQIIDFLCRLRLADGYYVWIRRQLKETKTGASKSKEVQAEALKGQLKATRRQMKVLTDLRVKEELAPEDFSEQYKTLVQKQVRLDQNIVEIKAVGEPWLEPTRKVVSFLRQAQKRFTTGGAEEKRAILRSVGSNLTVKDKKLHVEAKKPFQLMLERPEFPVWRALEERMRTLWYTDPCSFIVPDWVLSEGKSPDKRESKEHL